MSDAKQVSVAELLARNGQQMGGQAPSGRRRRGKGGMSVASLTGEIPALVPLEETPPAEPEPPREPEPQHEPEPARPAFESPAFNPTFGAPAFNSPTFDSPAFNLAVPGYDNQAPAYDPPAPTYDAPTYDNDTAAAGYRAEVDTPANGFRPDGGFHMPGADDYANPVSAFGPGTGPATAFSSDSTPVTAFPSPLVPQAQEPPQERRTRAQRRAAEAKQQELDEADYPTSVAAIPPAPKTPSPAPLAAGLAAFNLQSLLDLTRRVDEPAADSPASPHAEPEQRRHEPQQDSTEATNTFHNSNFPMLGRFGLDIIQDAPTEIRKADVGDQMPEPEVVGELELDATAAWPAPPPGIAGVRPLKGDEGSVPNPNTGPLPAESTPATRGRAAMDFPTAAWAMSSQEPQLLSGSTVAGDLMRNGQVDAAPQRWAPDQVDAPQQRWTPDQSEGLEDGDWWDSRSLGPDSGSGRSVDAEEDDDEPTDINHPFFDRPVDSDEEREADAAEIKKQWWILGGQVVAAIITGVVLFKGFEKLWEILPWVALALAVTVVLGLVAVVRILRRTDDLVSLAIAIVVGLFVTMGPLAFILNTS